MPYRVTNIKYIHAKYNLYPLCRLHQTPVHIDPVVTLK